MNIEFQSTVSSPEASEDEVMAISDMLMIKNEEAYKALAK